MKGWPVPLESDAREDGIRLVSEDEVEAGVGKGELYVLSEGEGENEAEVVVNVATVGDGSVNWLTEMHAIPRPLLSLRRVRRPRVLAGSNERSSRTVQ